jgi:hypothetical protein
MQLTTVEEGWLTDVGSGIAAALSFIGELTDYHGEPVSTEYILTVHIAKALLARASPQVAVEYLVNRIEGHVLIHDKPQPFTLGSQRFDVAILDSVAPVFIVEVKIGVSRIRKLADDLHKIMAYLDYLKPAYATGVLGSCVFQTHVEALGPRHLDQTTRRIHKMEKEVKEGLAAFAAANPRFESDWRPFQGPNDRIFDDERTQDIDGTPMHGRLGYAARYHAVLVRRRSGQDSTAPTVPWL